MNKKSVSFYLTAAIYLRWLRKLSSSLLFALLLRRNVDTCHHGCAFLKRIRRSSWTARDCPGLCDSERERE